MVVGKLPIYNPDIVMFFDDLMEKEIEYPASLSAPLVYPCQQKGGLDRGLNATDLLRKFLCRDPLTRISIDEILVRSVCSFHCVGPSLDEGRGRSAREARGADRGAHGDFQRGDRRRADEAMPGRHNGRRGVSRRTRGR